MDLASFWVYFNIEIILIYLISSVLLSHLFSEYSNKDILIISAFTIIIMLVINSTPISG